MPLSACQSRKLQLTVCRVAAKDAQPIDRVIDTQLTTAVLEVLLATDAEGGCGCGCVGGGDERILGLLRGWKLRERRRMYASDVGLFRQRRRRTSRLRDTR